MHQWFESATLRNDRLQFALTSILSCPERIINGKQLTSLSGIGVNLCNRIENRIREDGIDDYQLSTTSTTTSTTSTTSSSTTIDNQLPKRKKRKITKYIPQYRSGPYAVLLALFIEKKSLSKRNLIIIGQEYCHLPLDESTSSQSTSSQSWITPIQGALKTLQDKELITRCSGHPATFSLTLEGSSLARSLMVSGEGLQAFDDDNNHTDKDIDKEIDKEIDKDIYKIRKINTSSLEIILLIDIREKSRNDDERSFFLNKFLDLGIRAEVRVLEIGDFMWIARTPDSLIEIVLDCIIERKKESDLRSSIVDGRFKEQKYRLKLSQLSCIYLVEGENGGTSSITATSVAGGGRVEFQRELMDTMIIDRFLVRHTSGISETIRFIKMIHKKMEDILSLEGEYMLYGDWINGANRDSIEYMKFVKTSNIYPLLSPLSLRVSKSNNVKIKDILFKQLSLIRGGMNKKRIHSIIEGLGGISNLGNLWKRATRDGDSFLDSIQYSNDLNSTTKILPPSLKKRIYSMLCGDW